MKITDLVQKGNYGNYSSSNYGSHCQWIRLPKITLYFSYDTVVAFEYKFDTVCCENAWGSTTGKHLNWIERDHSKRLPHNEFTKKLEEVLIDLGLKQQLPKNLEVI